MKYFKLALILLTIIILAIVFIAKQAIDIKTTQENIFIIERNQNITQIANNLKNNNIYHNILLVRFTNFITRFSGNYIKSGEYLIPNHSNIFDIFTIFTTGKSIIHKITIPEGLSNYQIANILINIDNLKGNIILPKEEGQLMPDTYHFQYNDTKQDVIKRMQLAMSEFIKRNNINKETIILASIIEKETGKSAEREKISAVFFNRLKLGMPLQSDPTVIFAITDGRYDLNRPLQRSDLKYDSPYNTYIYGNIPPSPICNPSKASIMAVLNPINSLDLYFVSDNNGGHFFASSLKEHNENVRKYRMILKGK
jgi:UPF0755 protein